MFCRNSPGDSASSVGAIEKIHSVRTQRSLLVPALPDALRVPDSEVPMRFARMYIGVFLLFGLVSPALAQQTPNTVQRDPQALTVLAQALATTGGSTAIDSVKDFTATGDITYYWENQEIQGSAMVRGMGSNFRLDANLAAGTRSWAVSNAGGNLRNVDGSMSQLPWQNAFNCISITWPYPFIVAAMNNSSAPITYVGETTFAGQSAYDIRIQQVFPSPADPIGRLSNLTIRDLFIDSTTYLLIGTRDSIYSQDSRPQSYVHEVQFSDYRNVNGLKIPFSVAEFITGQKTWTLQLSFIGFNSGLTASDFVL
jgi:hypothetical protein